MVCKVSWSSEGVSLSKSMCGFFKGLELLGTLEVSSTDSIPTGFCNQKLWGLIFLALESWAGTGTTHPQLIPPKFITTTCGCGTSPFHSSTPPTSLDGCGFFNSIVVRLPLNLISDGSEWWLFYNLVVILMWLCEETSRTYLCHHLHWKILSELLFTFIQTTNILLKMRHNF